MPMFCRKPQVVEAFQWDYCVDKSQWPDWMLEAWNNGATEFLCNTRTGDWIVRDEDGHINRCPADMFQKVYVPDDGRQDESSVEEATSLPDSAHP